MNFATPDFFPPHPPTDESPIDCVHSAQGNFNMFRRESRWLIAHATTMRTASWVRNPQQCRTYLEVPSRMKAQQQPPLRPSEFPKPRYKPYLYIASATAIAGLGYFYITSHPTSTVEPRKLIVPEIQKSIPHEGSSNQNLCEAVSPQHFQVKKSGEQLGVYVWGSNSGSVADPETNENVVKLPRRIRYFDGKLLRDLKLDRDCGVAILDNGDLVQWGKGFSDSTREPEKTLTGKDLISLAISRDRIVTLSSNGTVYSLPVAKLNQEFGVKTSESTWLPFWHKKADISYRVLRPHLSFREKIISISAGLEHALLLTNSGRVFSAACASDKFPSRGQLGIPGLTWNTRPKGPFDVCHEIKSLRGIKQISTGDYHSVALDKTGGVFCFGDNFFGQLGVDSPTNVPYTDKPLMLPLENQYGKYHDVKATGVFAGGTNTFFTVYSQAILPSTANSPQLGHTVFNVWSVGAGRFGTLGNGKWNHVQDTPVKVKALSGLCEYNEKLQQVVPITLRALSVGSTNAAAVLNNYTNVSNSRKGPQADANWGSDILCWGGNEFYQLGTGKKNNVSFPSHINPPADLDTKQSQTEDHRFQISPRRTVRVGGRRISFEQRIECGRNITAIYSAV